MKEVIVNSKYDGKKLNNFLLNTFDGLSKNELYKSLRKKDIRIKEIILRFLFLMKNYISKILM